MSGKANWKAVGWRSAEIAIAVALLLRCSCVSADDETEFVGTDFNDTYTVTVTRLALQKSPSWNKQSENPLLPARKALKLATDFRKSFVKDAPRWKWELECIGLRHATAAGSEKWFWVAHFQEWPGEGMALGGVPPDLFVVVLMDGTVVKPVVKKRED